MAHTEAQPRRSHVGPVTAVANGISRTLTWRGRASRSEYWYFVLFFYVVLFSLAGLGAALEFSALIAPALLLYVSLLSAAVRRMHDIGRSGGWLWISLVPLIGAFVLLVLLTERGQPGPNRFGP
jgi:uncharacterized membrane protein YhaH (DUF805 family)